MATKHKAPPKTVKKTAPRKQQLRAKTEQPENDVPVRYIWAPPVAGVRMDEFQMIRVGTAWACVRYIAESIAALDWAVYQWTADRRGKEYDADHPADWLIGSEANPEMDAATWRETMLIWAATWGNGYSEIERDLMKRPLWLWPLTPDRVRPFRGDDGGLYYEVDNFTREPTHLPAADMFHLRGPSWDGILGYNLGRLASETLGLAQAAEQYAAAFFGNGAIPEGVLQTDQLLGQDNADRLASTWKQRHGGPKRQRGVAVLEQGLEWKPTGIDPEKGQLNDSRLSNIIAVCQWFKVPPQKVFYLLNASYASVEQTAKEAVTDSLSRWANRLEKECHRKLFGRTQRGVYTNCIDFSTMLRADTQAMTAHAVALQEHGDLDVDEVRELFNYNPIGGKLGKTRLVPMNFVKLEDAGVGAKQPAKSPEGNQSGSTMSSDDRHSQLLSVHMPLFLDAFQRCQTRAKSRGEVVLRKKLSRPAFNDWLNRFLLDHETYTRRALGNPAKALACLTGRVGIDNVLSPFIDKYLSDVRVVLTAAYEAGTVPVLNGEEESARQAAHLCLPSGGDS